VVRGLPGHWLAVEGPRVLTYQDLPPQPAGAVMNVLALDGRPLAWAGGHGQSAHWFASI